MTLKEKFIELTKSPTALFAILGVFLLTIALPGIRKIKFTTKLIAQVGIALALASVLQFFKFAPWAQGGSVTPGSMVPILLIAFVYGPEVGFLTGFLFGVINLILNPFILHPVQVLFDYPLPFMAIGLAGYFKDQKITGTFIAMAARFLCHFISGVVFFASYAPAGMSPYLYSLIYNGSYMILEAIICMVIIWALPVKKLSEILKNQ
jgi:thiamine transporter